VDALEQQQAAFQADVAHQLAGLKQQLVQPQLQR
jgi:hypothetical protein